MPLQLTCLNNSEYPCVSSRTCPGHQGAVKIVYSLQGSPCRAEYFPSCEGKSDEKACWSFGPGREGKTISKQKLNYY